MEQLFITMKIKFLRHLEYVGLEAFTISAFTTQATGKMAWSISAYIRFSSFNELC